MDLKNYMNIMTNLSIIITFIFSIILIIDELYNIGFFSFKYTYLYNYGSSISNFNNIQSIECESNRFNLYSNNLYLYKDIFSKSYFNFLLIIVITIITILFTLAYGINFYFTFILNQPEVCSFYKSTSFIKTIMKCLCDSCHEFIPDCTGNYFISFIILIIIPISYLLKLFLNFDITPNSTSTIYSAGYIILYIILIFTYSYILFNIDKTDNNTSERLINVLIYLSFTIIFIISFYIYKYIYNKYTDITLININNDETFYDIYKQTPPNKPRPVKKPLFKGKEFDFKYDPKSTDKDYKYKKELMDDYYKAIENYDKDLRYYTQKFSIYTNSNANLGDKTNFISIIINILGLNNRIHLLVIGLLILISGIYYFYNNDLLFICIIYLICIITILTIMNSILYYNTILNKYIIYEPLSNYKYDITTANTKLNLILDPSNGTNFYNILTNNQKQNNSNNTITINDINTVFNNISSLTIYDNFTKDNIININASCIVFPDINTNNSLTIPKNEYDIYYLGAASISQIPPIDNSNIKSYVFDKIQDFINIKYETTLNIDILYNYTFKPITSIYLYYSDISNIEITNLEMYNRYIYYYSYLIYILLNKIILLYPSSGKNNELNKLINIYSKIYNAYDKFKLQDTDMNTALIRLINTDNNINNINSIINSTNVIIDSEESINTNLINLFLDNIKYNILTINIDLLKFINTTINTANKTTTTTTETIPTFLYKLNINNNTLTLSLPTKTTATFPKNIFGITDKYGTGIIPTSEYLKKDKLIDNIKFANIDKITLFKIYSSKLLVLLPTKIIDNNNDEYSINSSSSSSSSLELIEFKTEKTMTSLNAYSINNSNLNYIFTINAKNKKEYTQKNKVENYTPKTTFNAPYKLQFISDDTNQEFNNLRKIILSSLIYNLIHITSKYESIELKKLLYYKSDNPGTKINNIERINYSSLFNIISLTDIKYQTSNFLKTSSSSSTLSSTNFADYAVVLYNSYTYDKNTITDIQEYLIYNKGNFNDTYYNTDAYLGSNISNIKTQIDKNVNKTYLITLYETNKYTINLITAIYENLMKYIKNIIETSIDSKLCHPTITSKKQIETLIYNHLKLNFNIHENANRTLIVSITTTNQKIKPIITEIGTVITNIFNIILFLLNNIRVLNNDTNKSDIINNFKFYNTDETINNTELSNITKELYIDCDYYNKYSNMDKKMKNYMKINADNVSYSFPVLLVIFIAIFCEPAFIKS